MIIAIIFSFLWSIFWLQRWLPGIEERRKKCLRLPPYSSLIWCDADIDPEDEHYLLELVAVQQVATSLVVFPSAYFGGYVTGLWTFLIWLVIPLFIFATIDWWSFYFYKNVGVKRGDG